LQRFRASQTIASSLEPLLAPRIREQIQKSKTLSDQFIREMRIVEDWKWLNLSPPCQPISKS
jgi:hypothetical protein